MMMETLKKTTTIVVLLITSQVMAQTGNVPVYGADISYPQYQPLTEDQTIVQAIGAVDDEVMTYFYRPIVDADSACTVKTSKNGKPYHTLVFSNCEGISDELAFVPVAGWKKLQITEENQRELVTKNKYLKQVYTQLDDSECGRYDHCSQTVEYSMLFSDYSVLNRASGDIQGLNNYQLSVVIKIKQNYWDMITDEPVIGRLPKREDAPSLEENIQIILNY